jgi:hypothetical protein
MNYLGDKIISKTGDYMLYNAFEIMIDNGPIVVTNIFTMMTDPLWKKEMIKKYIYKNKKTNENNNVENLDTSVIIF